MLCGGIAQDGRARLDTPMASKNVAIYSTRDQTRAARQGSIELDCVWSGRSLSRPVGAYSVAAEHCVGIGAVDPQDGRSSCSPRKFGCGT